MYLAHPTDAQDFIVAIKLLKNIDNSRVSERELQALKSLEHAYIVSLLDFGIDDNQPFLVLRYFERGSLAKLLHSSRDLPQPLDLIFTSKVLRQIGSALDYAHSKNIYHRDIKPSNILLDAKENAHIADFGIAQVPSVSDYAPLYRPGTPPYQAPETLYGNFYHQSDIYSLGIMVFEMLTGRRPFRNPQDRARREVPDPKSYNQSLPASLWRFFKVSFQFA